MPWTQSGPESDPQGGGSGGLGDKGVRQEKTFKLTTDAATSSTTFVKIWEESFFTTVEGGAGAVVDVELKISCHGTAGATRNAQITTSIDELIQGTPLLGTQNASLRTNNGGPESASVHNRFTGLSEGEHKVAAWWRVTSGSYACNAASTPEIESATLIAREVVE